MFGKAQSGLVVALVLENLLNSASVVSSGWRVPPGEPTVARFLESTIIAALPGCSSARTAKNK